MKSITLILALVLASVAFGQDDKYTKTMLRNLEMMDTAQDISSFRKIGNRFERVAQAEKSKWLPYYWTAYCGILSTFDQEMDKKDKKALMKKVDRYISIADSLSSDNSEVYVIRSFYYTGMMQIEGYMSAMKYAPLSQAALDKAIALNENNPRAYYLKGTGTLYTPPQFGGGKDKAKPILETAMQKYVVFLPESEIHPDWGKEQCEERLAECNASDEEVEED